VRTPRRAKHATHFEQIPVALVKKLLRQRDADAVQALMKRLHRHADALHAFHEALEAFHQQVGPLVR
jgi:ribosomal 50S subunit-associated protein YjgA (DUF615 family)